VDPRYVVVQDQRLAAAGEHPLMGRDLRLAVEDAHLSGAELYGGG
jgi:hypothetical protein